MNFKTTLILLVLLVAVGVAVYVTRDNGAKTATTTPDSEKKLLNFSAGDIDRLTIEPAGSPRMVLKRDGINWRLAEPLDAPADPTLPYDILSDLNALQSTGRVSATGADAAATGLQPPHFKVEMVTKDGKSIKLDVGDRSGTGGQLYVLRDGETQADLVQADVYDQLDKSLSDFRRKKLLDVSTSEVDHVEVDRAGGKLVLQKTGTAWTIQEPTTMPAETTAVTDMIMGLSNLQATNFVSDTDPNPRRYGLDRPDVIVSISKPSPATGPAVSATTQPEPIATVKFGFMDLQKKNVYLSTSASAGVVQVAASALDAFKKKPLDLRDKQVLSVDPATIATVTVLSNLRATTQPTTRPASEQTVELDRRHPPADAADTTVTALLSALHPLRATSYLETPPSADASQDHYTLTIDSEPPLMANYKIELTDPGNGKPLVGSYNGLTFEVDRAILTKLKADFTKATAPEPSQPDESSPTAAPSFPTGP